MNSSIESSAVVREGAGGLTGDSGGSGHRRRGIGGGGAKGDRGEPLGALGSQRDGCRRRVGEARRSPVNCVGGNGAPVGNSR